MSEPVLTPELRRIASLSSAEAHREGLPVVLVLRARIALCEDQADRSDPPSPTSWGHLKAAEAHREDLALVELYGTIGRRLAAHEARTTCPVCGATPWAEQIKAATSDGIRRTVVGRLHCPNEDDAAHVAYWSDPARRP